VTAFDQQPSACRCEWGEPAATALAPADVIIVVDVLSFMTCVDVAVARGAAILPHPWIHPHPWQAPEAIAFAHAHQAELASKRRHGRYSLAPESFLDAPEGLRCVLPSPNGAQVTLAAARTGAAVFGGCLRNARAVAEAAQRLGRTFNVIPAGERWPDGSLRPALEDWLGAGAIIAHLSGARSPEAELACHTFLHAQPELERYLTECGSARELCERGFPEDVALAAALNVSDCAPLLREGAYQRTT